MTEKELEKTETIEMFARETLIAMTYVDPITTRDWVTMGYATLAMFGAFLLFALLFV